MSIAICSNCGARLTVSETRDGDRWKYVYHCGSFYGCRRASSKSFPYRDHVRVAMPEKPVTTDAFGRDIVSNKPERSVTIDPYTGLGWWCGALRSLSDIQGIAHQQCLNVEIWEPSEDEWREQQDAYQKVCEGRR